MKNLIKLNDSEIIQSEDYQNLLKFINLPIHRTKEVFDVFKELPNAIYRVYELESEEPYTQADNRAKKFVFIDGTRKDRVLLVAHADTVWDLDYYGSYSKNDFKNTHKPILENGILKSSHHSHGIGADDRCGVALCYSLKDTGHSILIIDGEERGMIGSRFFVEENKDLFDYINKTHSFIIQFDRMREFEFNCYKETGTPEFIKYIENKTEFKQFKGPEAYTDIVTLCKVLAGVNFSVGYNLLHTPREYVDVNDYLNTLFIIRDWLSSEEKIERFEILDTYKTSFNKHIIANDYELETSNDMFVNLLRRLNDISIIERKIKRKKYKRNRQLSKKVKDEFQSWES